MARGNLQDGLVACRRIFLRQMADGAAALPGERALVDGILAQDDAKESRLARAVRADEPKAVAPQDRKGRFREQGPRSEAFGDAGKREHGWRRKSKKVERVCVETEKRTAAGRKKEKRRTYLGGNAPTIAFSSFSSFSVAVSLARLNSLTGTSGITDHFRPSLRTGKE